MSAVLEIVSNVLDAVEKWKKIEGYDNYEVSSLGRVRRDKSNNCKTIFTGTKETDGYIRVGLSKDGKCRKYKMHRLVAFAFIPNLDPINKIEVNHLGEKDDNRVCMLEWVTPQENSIHGSKKNSGTNHKLAINKIDIKSNEVIKLYKTLNEIKDDGFTMNKVMLCVNGKNKTHMGFKWIKVKEEDNITITNNNQIETYEDEIWKNLKDSIFDEVNKFTNYKVSNYGRIKGHFDRIMKPNCTTRVFMVQLRLNKVEKYMRLHRLVLMAFNIPRPEDKNEVDHIDSNSINNKLSNLQWADRKMQVNNENTKIKKTIKVKATLISTNEEKIYDGIKAMVKEIKVSINKIYKCVADNTSYNGYKFAILDDDNMRTEKCKKNIEKLQSRDKDPNKSQIKVTYNNETKIYKGINKLSKEIQIARNIIIKYSLLKTSYKGYNFEVLNTNNDDNIIILEKINSSKKEKNIDTIKVINIETNEETIHKGLTDLCKQIHITRSTIIKYINNKESYKGYKFELLSKKSFN